jgi:hypothetical protein
MKDLMQSSFYVERRDIINLFFFGGGGDLAILDMKCNKYELYCFCSSRKRLNFYISGLFFFILFQDVYFDDESAEVVISSLRLGDDQDR